MKTRFMTLIVGIGLVTACALAIAKEPAVEGPDSLHLASAQKEFLWLEPILVTIRLDNVRGEGLPVQAGLVGKAVQVAQNKSKAGQPAAQASKLGTLEFDIQPAVKARTGAKPLPLEGHDPDAKIQQRIYDLTEWFIFPDKGGSWTVRAVFEHNGTKLASEPITVALQKPAKGDPEFEPMSRLHHTPWSNYDTNAFCGDTFDLVQKWPASRFVKYCHYWNGRYSQNKKEYEKAIASYRVVVEKFPEFALADAAEYGIIECLVAQKKLPEAQKRTAALQQKVVDQAAKAGIKPGSGKTIVQHLTHGLDARLQRGLE
jgi:hypothetical protein